MRMVSSRRRRGQRSASAASANSGDEAIATRRNGPIGSRPAGIAMLALPSLVTPETSTGERISVAAHVGGLAAGLGLGILALRWRRRKGMQTQS